VNSYTVTWEGGLNLRKAPNQDAEMMGSISVGTAVEGLKEEGDWLQIRHGEIVAWTVLRFDGELQYSHQHHFKYISTAPDVDGQDDEPNDPISNGICQRCGRPKEQHATRGALASLNLASNSLGAEGAKIIAAVLPKCT
jgi:hypothetical protein